ncbi:MAG: NfeD family protein [Tistlia sp.]|uniref:NfeD family protein n=1 Tax=Tistlia sp. TaxID=3057121 RepID=UPI0034A5199D
MIEQLFDFTWGWIIAGVVIAGLEILIPGVFLLWIGLGALAVGLLLSLFPDLPVAWQSLVFAVAMLASLGLGFWLQRRSGSPADHGFLNRETEAMVGQRYLALTAFVAGRGRITVQDSSFAALSDEPIAAGELVEVVAIVEGKPKVAKAAQG